MKKRIILGVGGNIGAGKTTVAKIFEGLGAHYLSADEIGWDVLPEIADKLKEKFGDVIFGPDGCIDRKRLRELVFAQKKRLQILNSLSHPILLKRIIERLNRIKKGIVVIDAALLYDWPEIYRMVDFPILVVSKKELKRKRAYGRDISGELFNRVLRAQKSESEMAKLAKCIIKNNSTISMLKRECRRIYRELKNDC